MGIFRRKKEQTSNTSPEAKAELQRAIDISSGKTSQPTGSSELQRAIDNSKTTTTTTPEKKSYGGSSGGSSPSIPTGTIQDLTTEAGRQQQAQANVSKGLDKFGRTQQSYDIQQVNLKSQSLASKQTAYYQSQVNSGRMNEIEANKQLNKVLTEYNKDLYRQKGYEVKENPDGTFTIQKPQTITKSERFGGVFLTPSEASKYPQGQPSETISENELMMQESIKSTENILGIPEGSSGMGYVPEALVSRQAPPVRETQSFGGSIVRGYERVEDVGSNFIGVGVPLTPLFLKAEDIPPAVGKGAYYGSVSISGVKQYVGIPINIQKEISTARTKQASSQFATDILIPQTPSQVLITGLSIGIPVARANALNKVIPQTSFIGTIARKEEGSLVQVYAKTQRGKQVTQYLSKEIVFEGNENFLGGGFGYTKYNRKGTAVIEKIGFVGTGKQLGNANLVFAEGFGAKASYPIGEGITSRTFLKSSGKGLKSKQVYNPIKNEFENIVKLRNIQSFTGTKNQLVTGITKGVGETGDMFLFKGTNKPILRIYKKGGITQIVRKPNIKGLILIDTGEDVGYIKSGITSSQKLISPPTSLEQQSLARQLGSIPTIKAEVSPISPSSSLITSEGINKLLPQVRTQELIKPVSQMSITSNVISERQSAQIDRTNFFTKAQTNQQQNIKLVNLNLVKQPLVNKTKQKSTSVSNSAFKELQLPKTEQVLKINQVQQTKQLQKQIPMLAYKSKKFALNKLSLPLRLTPKRTGKPFVINTKIKTSKSNKGGLFTIYERRFGKFKPIGKASDLSKAFNIGVSQTGSTLGATYKVQDVFGKTYANPNKSYYTKYSKKEGIVNIQRRKYRLSSSGERKEINLFKQMAIEI